jgi:hypothetical protein
MGTTLCWDSQPVIKPASTHSSVPVDLSLKRLLEKAKTLPVIMEEETGTPDPTPKQRPRRSTGRLELKAVVVRRRLKEGFRREGVLPSA